MSQPRQLRGTAKPRETFLDLSEFVPGVKVNLTALKKVTSPRRILEDAALAVGESFLQRHLETNIDEHGTTIRIR